MNESETRAPTVSRGDLLEDFVGAQAAYLARLYQADSSGGVARLARLRRGVSTTGRVSADVWELFEGFPTQLMGHDDLPNPAELAALYAMTLFSIHQQSRRDVPMHQRGRDHGVGRAVGRLHAATSSPGVERRFRALTRSSTIVSAGQHLRGLVTQLRGERIALDYGLLARDLYRLQLPAAIDGVRIGWIRDYHRGPRRSPDPQGPQPATDDRDQTQTTTGEAQ